MIHNILALPQCLPMGRGKRGQQWAQIYFYCVPLSLNFFFFLLYIKYCPFKGGRERKKEGREGEIDGKVLILDFYQESTWRFLKFSDGWNIHSSSIAHGIFFGLSSKTKIWPALLFLKSNRTLPCESINVIKMCIRLVHLWSICFSYFLCWMETNVQPIAMNIHRTSIYKVRQSIDFEERKSYSFHEQLFMSRNYFLEWNVYTVFLEKQAVRVLGI